MLLAQLVACAAICGAGETMLLDFTASWCGPCQAMEPVVRRLLNEGQPVRQIDIDQHRDLASQFRVSGIPCFVMLVDGQEVDRVEGPASYERLARMLSQAGGAVTRGQSPAAAPSDRQAAASDSSSSPAERAFAATVRLKIEDAGGVSYGAGTIIDARQGEALVLTCGHLFRDTKGQGRLSADIFAGGRPQTMSAQVLRYDLERDLGLVLVRPAGPVQSARLVGPGYTPAPGMKAFSIGCDRGAAPTVHQTQITAVDRYLGTPNIEAHGAPEVGRSGGGLFDSQGALIGVCNGAQKQDNEGVYASYRAVHAMLDELKLAHLYQSGAAPQAIARQEAPAAGAGTSDIASAAATPYATDAPVSRGEAPSLDVRGRPAGFDYTQRGGKSLPPHVAAAQAAHPAPSAQAAYEPQAPSNLVPIGEPSMPRAYPASREPAVRFAAHGGEDSEVICIIRPRGNPSAESKVFVLSQPSRQFLDQISAEAAATTAPSAGAQALQAARPASLQSRPGNEWAPPSWPEIRAQSPE